jgi:FtsH-binding integral membrane protein
LGDVLVFALLSQAAPNPSPAKPRRWSIVAAGLLLLALALVVIYTSRAAFSSPLALVVVAAIGLAALLLQLRLRKDLGSLVHAPLWLNAIGLLFALAAVFADHLRLSTGVMAISALGAVICFGLSGTKVIHTLRKRK